MAFIVQKITPHGEVRPHYARLITILGHNNHGAECIGLWRLFASRAAFKADAPAIGEDINVPFTVSDIDAHWAEAHAAFKAYDPTRRLIVDAQQHEARASAARDQAQAHAALVTDLAAQLAAETDPAATAALSARLDDAKVFAAASAEKVGYTQAEHDAVLRRLLAADDVRRMHSAAEDCPLKGPHLEAAPKTLKAPSPSSQREEDKGKLGEAE